MLSDPVLRINSKSNVYPVKMYIDKVKEFPSPFWGSILKEIRVLFSAAKNISKEFPTPSWGAILKVAKEVKEYERGVTTFPSPFWGSILKVDYENTLNELNELYGFPTPFWGSILKATIRQ